MPRSAKQPNAHSQKTRKQSRQPPQKNGYSLPKLDGVVYKTQTTNNGEDKIFASGNTHAKKEFLKSAGFRWDNQRKTWWRAAHGDN